MALLDDLLAEHTATPFPRAVVDPGEDYGEVSVVMIGPDIVGWAERAGRLPHDDLQRLRATRDELARSLDEFLPLLGRTTNWCCESPTQPLP